MWLTGFDVPSLATLYLDKPLKAHTLMQTIARANRVHEGKNNGLIVDYCGILKNLRRALATFATGVKTGGQDPIKPEKDLLEELSEAIDLTRSFLKDRGFVLEKLLTTAGFHRIAAIKEAKEVINQSEETRKRFEILAREVFKKFQACLTIRGILKYKKEHDAIEIIYQKLQDDRDKADITEVIRELHSIVDTVITPVPPTGAERPEEYKPYDISKIDFNRLKE
jgi:type I restriction enzyme R subunit